MTNNENTQTRILKAGKQEFLEKGFKNASLRSIAKAAGVTTGAIYGYFSNKEALFKALVMEPTEILMEKFLSQQTNFANLPPEQQRLTMHDVTGQSVLWAIDYIYDHFDAFKLTICCSSGTEYETFIDRMVEIEVESCNRFFDALKQCGHQPRPIDNQLTRLLSNAMYSSMFEAVRRDMDKQTAIRYITNLADFFSAGWDRLLGF